MRQSSDGKPEPSSGKDRFRLLGNAIGSDPEESTSSAEGPAIFTAKKWLAYIAV